jgi:hypothetical protein
VGYLEVASADESFDPDLIAAGGWEVFIRFI